MYHEDKKYSKLNGEEVFTPMVTFGNVKLICLYPIPKGEFEKMEKIVENCLEHETIHIVLANLIDEKASRAFDNVFPLDTDLREFMEES